MKQAKVIYNKGFYIGDEVKYIEETPLYLISKGIVRIAVDGGLAYYKKGDTEKDLTIGTIDIEKEYRKRSAKITNVNEIDDLSEKEYKLLKRKYNLTKILDYYFDCREQTIDEIDKDSLPKLKDLDHGGIKTPLERIIKYLDQGYNPYFAKINGRIVEMHYSNDGITIEDYIHSVVEKEIETEGYLPHGKIIVVRSSNLNF